MEARVTEAGRVLVVDDTPFNRRLLVRLLATIGHDSSEASDGREALAMLRDPDAPPIDVVLLDIVMPEMDGYETLAALKADESPWTCRSSSSPASTASTAWCAASGWGRPITCPIRCIRPSCGPGSRHRWPRSGCGTSRHETLAQQMAINDGCDHEPLGVRSRSYLTLVAAAARLCHADYGVAYVAADGPYHVVASAGGPAALDEYERSQPIAPGRATLVGRVAMTAEPP